MVLEVGRLVPVSVACLWRQVPRKAISTPARLLLRLVDALNERLAAGSWVLLVHGQDGRLVEVELLGDAALVTRSVWTLECVVRG